MTTEIEQAFPYEVLAGSPKEIGLVYVVILLACIVAYPVVSFIVSTIAKGLAKWR
ncbi:hypothetical protein ACNQFZ_06640 [Schinkia sp. CFF1]